MAFLLTASSSVGQQVANAVTTANIDLTSVVNEVIALLPVVLPTIVVFLGVRKGISFLIGSLRRA